MFKNIILVASMIFCFFGEGMTFNADAFKTWDSIKTPRALSRVVSFDEADNETVRPIAKEAIEKLIEKTPKSFSILWAGKESFKQVDNSISYWCEKQIQTLKGQEESNYFIGYMLLRSQVNDDKCSTLITDFDIDIAMAGISLLQNEKNGKKDLAINILRSIAPAMKKIGRIVRIQE